MNYQFIGTSFFKEEIFLDLFYHLINELAHIYSISNPYGLIKLINSLSKVVHCCLAMSLKSIFDFVFNGKSFRILTLKTLSNPKCLHNKKKIGNNETRK